MKRLTPRKRTISATSLLWMPKAKQRPAIVRKDESTAVNRTPMMIFFLLMFYILFREIEIIKDRNTG